MGRDRTVPPNLFVLGELIEELPAYVFGKRIPRTGGTAAYRSGIEMGFSWGALPVPGKREYPLKDWDEAVSFLLSCETHFASYEEIRKSLKPFSLKLR